MALSSTNAANPYASPGECSLVLPGRAGEPVTAELLRASPMRRVLELRGGVACVLEWNALWPTEFIRIHGHKLASQHSNWYVPRFDFVLKTEELSLPAEVHIRMSRWLPIFLREFALVVGGETIYQEPARDDPGA